MIKWHWSQVSRSIKKDLIKNSKNNVSARWSYGMFLFYFKLNFGVLMMFNLKKS